MFDSQALEHDRKMKDNFFKNHPQSPLTPDQRTAFTNLDYFPPREDLDLTLDAEELDNKDLIQIQTSTGTVQTYQRWGRIHFEVDGEKIALTIYYSPNSGHFFLPFKDATNGPETYGAGRYIDPEYLGGTQFHVDFNNAYSPYCAYNDNWTCPLTPLENHLKVRIEAGEKKPDDTWANH